MQYWLTVAMCDSVSELAVIGAGLPRTGTLSVKAALEFLLGGPCYHGSLPFSGREGDQTVWREAFSTESIHPVLECGILRGFKAGVDHPFMCWYSLLYLGWQKKELVLPRVFSLKISC